MPSRPTRPHGRRKQDEELGVAAVELHPRTRGGRQPGSARLLRWQQDLAICPITTTTSICRASRCRARSSRIGPTSPGPTSCYLHYAGDSTIHQLQLEAVKRFSYGLNFQLEYSWNRSLDNTPIVGGPLESLQHRGRPRQLRPGSPPYLHLGLLLRAALRSGQGTSSESSSGSLGKVIGGWRCPGITYLRTGQPFSVAFNATQPGWRSGRADVVERRSSLARTSATSPAGSTRRLTRFRRPFTFGNSARNLLFGPGDIVFDVCHPEGDGDHRTASRLSSVLSSSTCRTTLTSATQAPISRFRRRLGRITGAGDPRQIQFGLKLLF